VGFLRLDQALAGAMPADRIFAGPALNRGFIDRATLPAAERRVALHSSDVIREIMAAPGVRAIRSIRLARSGDGAGDQWSLTLDDSCVPRLDLNASVLGITLVKDRQKVVVDTASVLKRYVARAREARLFPVLPDSQRDLAPSPGRARNLAAYLPLETDLPRIYGVGAGALPDSAPDARKAQANQLRGYLMLLDQLLANEFAQLALFASLFSVSGNSSRNYVGQLAGQAASSPPILRPGFSQDELDDMAEPGDSSAVLQRSNRLLNHLLGRFGETVTDNPQILGDPDSAKAEAAAAQLLQAKRAFLRGIPRLGSARGTGIDYLSGSRQLALADRVRFRMGWPDDKHMRFIVVEHILLRALPEDEINAMPLLAKAARGDPWSAQLSFVFQDELPLQDGRNPLEAMIQRIIREETPAHLTPYLIWLPPDAFAAFAAAYDDLLNALRRRLLADRLGSDPDAPTPENII
jgi:hypothetical protein